MEMMLLFFIVIIPHEFSYHLWEIDEKHAVIEMTTQIHLYHLNGHDDPFFMDTLPEMMEMYSRSYLWRWKRGFLRVIFDNLLREDGAFVKSSSLADF